MDMPNVPGADFDPKAMRGMVQLMTALHTTVNDTVMANGGKGMNRETREQLIEALVGEVLTFLVSEVPMIFGGTEGDER